MDKDKEETKDSRLYFDLSKQERDSAIRYLLGSIIKSRKDSTFPSNYYTFDEDVNVYLAHLLFAVSLPEYHEMSEPYLSMDTSDIIKWVRGTEDKTIRYFIFKVNADHILLHTAIFEDLEKKSPNKIFKKSARHYRELAQLYYDQAAIYHNRIYRKKTGLGDVLDKLSRYFDAYQGMLKTVRRDYFDFVTNFKDQAFRSFMKQLDGYESEFNVKGKIDRFLDLYGQWLETKNPEIGKSITEIVSEIQRLDPGFQFNLNELKRGGMQDERKCA